MLECEQSADISRDEQIHVATNSLVCTELGLTLSSLDKLRKATINWVMQPLGHETGRFWTKNFGWILAIG